MHSVFSVLASVFAAVIFLALATPALAADKPEPLPGGLAAHMLLPGFEVRELPVELSNLVQISYADDGRLFALGYDGRIHVLRDRNGDGMEETIEPFWYEPPLVNPIGMALSPEGLYVSSKSKVSLFRDTNKDGRADNEEIITTGWKGPTGAAGGLDAYGLARDPKGAIYFNIGISNFMAPFEIDKDDKPRYSRHGERGSVLKIRPDGTREIIASGVRFAVGLAFNKAGDLFASEQEGATWLPDANPLDELLHITPNRHYGFPPQHRKYLPDVIDEPAVAVFEPQHQSTCGLDFDETTRGRKRFGPASFEGNAIVSGYSRGKIWRVPLTKTPAGYVGQPVQIATVGLLTVDTAVSPSGALAVALHTGRPDWGTGPKGAGKLVKIFYKDTKAPQPIATWASSPVEVNVAFDRPIDPIVLERMRDARIEYGAFVGAGDRFEKLWPGYRVVEDEKSTPRRALKVVSSRLADNGRTLVLTTDAHPYRSSYALTLPQIRSPGSQAAGATVDLAYKLDGVEVTGGTSKLWQPHLDPEVTRNLTRGSAPHDAFGKQKGPLVIKTNVTFAYPGRIVLPPRAILTLTSSDPFEAALGNQRASSDRAKRAQLTVEGGTEPIPLEITVKRRSDKFTLHAAFRFEGDDHDFPLNLNQLSVPWAKKTPAQAPVAQNARFQPGDWKKGHELFFGEARCSTCHTVRGEGAQVGPDLSNLVYVDPSRVLSDVMEPNAAINPDFLTYQAKLRTGEELTGVLQVMAGDQVRLVNAEGGRTIARRDLADLRPSDVSLMPAGLEVLGPDRLRDIVTFLTRSSDAQQDHPSLVRTDRGGAPPPRTRAEVDAVLGPAFAPSSPPRALKIVLVAGKKDHGPGEHDYPAWQPAWSALLGGAPGVAVTTAQDWPSAEQLRTADVLVFFNANAGWGPVRGAELDAYLGRGGGAVYIHYALNGGKEADALSSRIGLAWHGYSRFRHGWLTLKALGDSPITRGFENVRFLDETYWGLKGDRKQVQILASAIGELLPEPMFWTREVGKGRVFASVLGHYSWTFNDPLFRVLALRGIAWAAREPIERLERLATVGVLLR